MKIKLLLIGLGAAVLAISISASVASVLKSMQPCEQVMVLAVGGCDSAGLCAVVIGNQQGQVRKATLPYPIAGVVECIKE